VILQVETRCGVEAAAEIAAVPGVDALVIGPADLSVALGLPGQLDHPQFQVAVRHAIAASRQAGVASGIFTGSAETVGFWLGEGMRWFCCGTDEGLVGTAAAELRRQIRGRAEAPP
jgi:2-keto-3-deoxy-L-rhamnonate aldolase RhmA